MVAIRPINLMGRSLQTDVTVVGAGPAGCAAAYDLATRGIGVLLLDRTEFPRHKACAGGLTVKTVQALRYSIAPVIQASVRTLSASCRMHHRKLLTGVDPICHMVQRPAFDLYCLQKTVAAGADFAVVQRIDKISESERRVSVFGDFGVIRTRFLIGADGVHSRIRRLTGRFASFRTGFAVEGMVKKVPRDDPPMGFDFSRARGGYGWVFPKKDHINVGLYTQRAGVTFTRKDLADYATQRLGDATPASIIGYPLGMGGWRYHPGRGRTLLVGDAAGLVDPLLGEGLYHAITSGQRAAAAIGTSLDTGGDACMTYADLLMPVQRELLFSQIAAKLFYRLPAIGHALLTSPAARIPLMKGFARGLPLLDIFCHGHRFWLGMALPATRKPNTF